MDNQNEIPLPTRMSKLESMLESVVGTLDTFKTLLSGVPVVGNVIAQADNVGHAVIGVVDLIEAKTTPDAASLAAGSIAISTGNPTIDARLLEIETFIASAAPLLAVIARHFGLDAPAASTPAAPMV